jgi:predicted ATP-binding protein involved in virulence
MKIKNVHMENIRLFREFDLSFVDDNTNSPHNVILIVGENGTGKSTLLKSIVSCFTTNNSIYGGEIFGDEDVSNDNDIGKIVIDTQMNHTEIDYFGDKIKRYDFFQYIVKNENGSLQKSNTCVLIEKSGSLTGEHNIELHNIVTGNPPDNLLVIYFDVFRIIPKTQISGPDTAKLPKSATQGSLASSINHKNVSERFNYTKQWLVNADYREDKLYRQTGRESGLMKKITDAFDILFAPYKFSRISYDSKILFETPDGMEVDIDNLSDGLKSVFSIIGEMLFRFSFPYVNQEIFDLNLIFDTEAVVLIDEIDCHLHPKWQLNIIPALRGLFPNVQFIMTTHAPLIVSSVFPDEVYQLGGG